MNSWLEAESGVRIPLHSVCTIGRSPKNTLVLADSAISRRHALIHAQGGEHWLVDLGSSNGVQLNGRRVRQPMELQDGDLIDIMGSRFTFRQATPAPANPDEEKTKLVTIKDVRSTRAWLVLADIEKSTQLCQSLPADQFSQLVGRWLLACKEIVEEHAGTINKYLGDGFLAYWDASHAPPATIAKLLGQFKNLQSQQNPAFRLALHQGGVTVDQGVSEGEESLLGPEVNFLFRMEKLAGALQKQCLLSQPAAEQLLAISSCRPIGGHALAGFDGSHTFYEA